MENVLRLSYRQDLDMPELIRPKIYRKIKSAEIHTIRISAALDRVEDATEADSAINLEFCLTGYYPCGKHYICAVWPRHPAKVDFHFLSTLEYEQSFPGGVFGPREGETKGDPSTIEVAYSRRIDARSKWYMFFRENPHLSHRPYFFTMFDGIFSRQDQDDEKVLAHYRDGVSESLKQGRDLFGGLLKKVNMKSLTAEELIRINRLSERLQPHRDILKAIDEIL